MTTTGILEDWTRVAIRAEVQFIMLGVRENAGRAAF